jgi:hypothetical protein
MIFSALLDGANDITCSLHLGRAVDVGDGDMLGVQSPKRLELIGGTSLGQ